MFRRIKDRVREKILTINVAHLYNTTGEDDILARVGVDLTVRGKPLPKEIQTMLKAEAEMLLRSKLWEYMQKDIRYRANIKMYEQAESVDDIKFGKMWLYTLEVMNNRLERLVKER